jgi:Transposase, Mutator family
LAKKYNCSKRTVQRKIDLYTISSSSKKARSVVVLTDTTYWGRSFGVMLFKDAITKENLLKYYVKTETNTLYREGIKDLKSRGFTIVAIVCDGRKGLIQSFKNIPVQMCQFHQVAIIRRYITKNPKLQASKELKSIVDLIKQTDKESFQGALEAWSNKWESFLNERTINPETGKSHYTHKRLRSAYRSLKNNLPWLFTWYDNIELNIPNTTNAIDGHFADLKNKLRNHNGLSLVRKMKFIDGFLKA